MAIQVGIIIMMFIVLAVLYKGLIKDFIEVLKQEKEV